MDRLKTFGAFVVACTAVASCSNGQVGSLNVDEPAAKPTTAQPNGNTVNAMNTTEQVNAAKQALVDEMGVAMNDIEVESARSVTWRSGAAGCPKPGMSYTMALVPGMLIVLKANGETYRYHAAKGRAPSYCPADRAEAPATGMGEEVM